MNSMNFLRTACLLFLVVTTTVKADDDAKVTEILQRFAADSREPLRVRFRMETRVLKARDDSDRDRTTLYELVVFAEKFLCRLRDIRPGHAEFPAREESFSFDGMHLRELHGPDPPLPSGAIIRANERALSGGRQKLLSQYLAAVSDFIEPNVLRFPSSKCSMLTVAVQHKLGGFPQRLLTLLNDRSNHAISYSESIDGSSRTESIMIRGSATTNTKKALQLRINMDPETHRPVSVHCVTADTIDALSDSALCTVEHTEIRWNNAGQKLPTWFSHQIEEAGEVSYQEETTISDYEAMIEEPTASRGFGWTALKPAKGQIAEFDNGEKRKQHSSLEWFKLCAHEEKQRDILSITRVNPAKQNPSFQGIARGNIRLYAAVEADVTVARDF